MGTKAEVATVLEAFERRFANALLLSELMGREPWESLLTELKGVREIFAVADVEETYTHQPTPIIDRLKLAAHVLSLKNAEYSCEQIADVLVTQTGQIITEAEVETWLANYTNIGSAAKAHALKGSVFDTQNRMQEIYEMLIDHLDRVENMDDEAFRFTKTSRPEIMTDLYREMRQLSKDAAQIMAAVSNMHRFKEFQQIVVETIGQVSPIVQQQIIRRLNEQKVLLNSLLPPN